MVRLPVPGRIYNLALREEHLVAAGLSQREVSVVIDALLASARPIVPNFRWRPQLRDANDEMVLEAAVNGGAKAIVTFNRRDFRPAAARFGVELLLPREALEILR